MAEYSMTLRLLTQTCDIGLQDYPIWDESYRERLNNVIVNHFMFREIAAPTPMAFVYKLNAKMYEIMPKYNAFYELQDNMKLSLLNVDLEMEGNTTDNRRTISDRDVDNTHFTKSDTNEASNKQDSSTSESSSSSSNTGSSSDTTNNTSSNTNRFSDTPQGLLANSDLSANNTYLTTMTLDNGTDNTTTTGSTSSTGSSSNNTDSMSNSAQTGRKHSSSEYEQSTYEVNNKNENRRGSNRSTKKGIDHLSEAKILKEYYEAIQNIDQMILHELEVLFIQILH